MARAWVTCGWQAGNSLPFPPHAPLRVRAKRILGLKNINVYAVGIYVDTPAAKKALHKYKSAGEASVQNQQMYDGEWLSQHP